MTGNIENAARTLGDAIRSAAEIIAAALRQNSWTYQPPVQTIPNTVPYVPYQPYISPTVQPSIYPTVTCESNSLSRTASGRLGGCVALNQADGNGESNPI